jgi:hypothetical protein
MVWAWNILSIVPPKENIKACLSLSSAVLLLSVNPVRSEVITSPIYQLKSNFTALQLAKLSGFSPIITTASLKHTDYLKSLGATHVLDRNLQAASLKSEISKITSEPIKYVFDSVSLPETQQLAYDVLASGGTLGIVNAPSIQEAEDRSVVQIRAIRTLPHNAQPIAELFGTLTEWLENGVIKASTRCKQSDDVPSDSSTCCSAQQGRSPPRRLSWNR